MLASRNGGSPTPLRDIGEVEIARCRRLGTPLSLLVVAREHGGQGAEQSARRLPARWRRPSQELERLSTTVEPHVRAYDSLVLDPVGRRIAIVAPEATATDADRMRERLEAVLGDAGPVHVGVVTFPDDGAFIHELVARVDADRRTATSAVLADGEGVHR